MPPNPTSLSCGQVLGFNLDANGYVGGNPTSGSSGCNPCCYAGSDLDCDGVQDVPFSVENSEWFKYCNNVCPLQTVTVCADEIGTGNQCNIQGAVWVGSTFNSALLDCNNSQYQQYGSNPGGAADGWCLTVTIPQGQCVFFMVDGYGGATCSSVSVSITCAPCPCTSPTVTTTQTNVNCNGQCTGSATATGSGATAPYTYSWNTSPVQNTQTATGLCAGTYSVTVTDALGCTKVQAVTITQPAALTASASGTNPNCNGGTGSACVTAGGGTPAYTYAWSPSGGNSSCATGLSAGNYTVTVTDNKGCTKTATVSITQPPVLTASIGSSTSINCNGLCTGNASVTAGGGTPAYTYAWNPSGGNSSSATGLCAGNYTVTVTDSKGCTKTSTVSITQPAVLTASIGSSTSINCNGVCTGSASVTAGGGTPAYTYSWNPSGGNSSSATGLCAGNYTVTVTDSKGCTKTATVSITQPAVLTASIGSSATINCNGLCTGSASVTAGGGTPAYTYAWNPSGGNSSSATGLCAGNYTVTVTDNKGCTKTATVSITQPAILTASIGSSTSINCNGVCTGSASVTAGGGTPAYTYAWNPSGGNSSSATGLCAGNYTVTVTDSKGCTKTATVSITQPAVLTASIGSSTSINCNGVCTGSASVTAGGGTPAYTYAWSPSGGNSSSATGLCAGNYTVTVTDSKGCTKTTTVSITQPAALTSSASATNPNCNGGTGSACVTAGGGTPAYTYAWSPSGGNSSCATGLSAGNYTATVTDSKGCAKTATVSITQPAILTASIGSSTSVNCNGVCTGSASVTAGGGTPAYTYVWSPSGGNSSSATGLCAGNYTATITDANGCTKTATVSITQPTALTVSVTTATATCGFSNGSASATVSGGNPSYTYSWSNGQTTTNATGLTAGTYTLTVTDASGCTTISLANISNTGSPTATISPVQNVSCNGGSNGSLTANVTSGTPPFNYSWNSGQTTSAITGLSSGNYQVTITDGAGCIVIVSVTITQPSALTTTLTPTQVNCSGGNDGGATVTIGGGTPSYTYSWSPSGGTSSTATGLPAGNYTVSITDGNGCTNTATVAITQPTALTSTISSTNPNCNSGTGSACVTAGGGTPAYTYSWNPSGGNSSCATGLSAGNYTATITDANGCTKTTTVSIAIPTVLTSTISSTNPNCNGGTGTAAVAAAGGSPAYTYSWSPSGGSSSSATGLSAGNYTATITDANGCATTATASVTQPAALTSTISSTNPNCNGGTGTAAVAAAGGSPAYTYSWSPSGGSSSSATGLSAGNYTVTLSDANGCTNTATVSITQPAALTSTVSSTTTVSCNGGNDGSAAVTAGGGNPGYTYSWNPSGQTNSTATGLTAGNYTVTVTDTQLCVSTATINIAQPTALTSSITATVNACNGGNNGSATVAGSGGTPSYTYSWNNGQTSATATGLSPGNYTATVTDGNGCISTVVATVSNSGIIANIAGATTICSGTNATLTASGGTDYSWSTGATTSSITATITSTSTYTVIVSNGICGDTTSATITVAPSVTASVTGNSAICIGDTITLTASGGTDYSWSNGSTNSSITVNPSSTTNYSVTVSSGICSDNASTTVTVNPLPTINISGTTTICSGASTTLTASGGTNYSWNTGATTSAITVTPSGNTSYTVTATDANSCSNVDSINVVIDSVTAVAPSQFICKGAGATLTASGGNNYSWSTGATTASITVSPATTTTYTVNVSDGICSDTAIVTVNVFSTVVAIISGPDTICSGYSATLTASGGTNYVWNTGATTSSIIISPSSATTYSVIASISSCMEDTSFTVTVIPSPTATASSPATICIGSSATLTASGGGNYSWNNGSTTSSIVVTPSTTTNYIVTVTSANGCTDTSSVLVTTNPNINPTISPSAICQGDSALLTASGGGTYSWNTGATTSSIYVFPTTTTSYTVTVVNGICTASAVATVTVTAGITAIITGQTSLCPGDSTTLSVTGGSSFLWSTGATSTSIVVTPSSSTSYSVVVTSSSCSDSASVTVTVNPLPAINITGPDTVCTGQLDSLIASGGNIYNWSTGDTNDTILIAPTVTTNYSVTATDSNGCTNISSFTVVTSPNIVTSVAPSAICSGDSALLTATGGGNYLWSTGATTSSIYVSPTTTTSYSVDVTNGFCTASAMATVTVAGSITASVSGPNSICAGSSATLTASGGSSFSWSTGATTSSITISPTGNTSYTVTAGSASCSDDTSIAITVNPLPTPVISGATTICSGVSTTLSVTGGNSFSWSNGATSSSIIISPTSNSNYTVTVTDANGCSDTTSANVSVTTITANISGGGTTICSGTSTMLSVTGGTNYSWSTGATTTSISLTLTSTSTFTVVVSDASGCSDTATATVTVSPAPVATVNGNATICAGDAVTLTASGGGNYSWSNGQTTNPISVSPPSSTTYSVIVSIGTCADTASATVSVNNNPVANAGADVTILIGSAATLSASGGSSYSWIPATGLSCTNCQSPVANPSVTTNYCVFVTDAFGCEDSACVTVYVDDNKCDPVYLPNAFSPNGDLENDILYLYGECIKEMKLIIYDRWGEKVFEGSAQAEGWDGMHDGNLEGSAVFTYYLTYTLTTGESVSKKGNVSLMR